MIASSYWGEGRFPTDGQEDSSHDGLTQRGTEKTVVVGRAHKKQIKKFIVHKRWWDAGLMPRRGEPPIALAVEGGWVISGCRASAEVQGACWDCRVREDRIPTLSSPTRSHLRYPATPPTALIPPIASA